MPGGIVSLKPYYEEDGITIYHGDCREVFIAIQAPRFDLLLTDPPYGLREAAGKNKSRTNVAVAQDYGHSTWDDAPAHEAIALLRPFCEHQIIFGGNYYHLPPTSCWLVWDKDNGTNDFADCELAWTNLNKAVRKLTHRWNGMLQQPNCEHEWRQHPTQKPEPVMRWALSHAPVTVRTVLDPFMGSGTTLVEAKRAGKTATGIDREERYCEIAANRLRQRVLPLEMADGR